MKKLLSLLLALVMLVSLAVPAFAVDEPTEIGPDEKNELCISNKGNYIINKDCEVKSIVSSCNNFTLTIAKGVTVKVTTAFFNKGSINVLGTLIIAGANTITNNGTINVVGTLSITDAINAVNSGTVRVYGCTGGKLEGTINYSGFGTVTTYDGHYYVDGKCFACGYECPHEDLKCNTCGKNFPQKAISSEGGIASAISEGNMTIATEIGPNGNDEIPIPNKGNYIINKDCEATTIMSSHDNSTLTIAKGVTVKVTKNLYNRGSINVLGTLIITDTAEALNNGTINVVGTLIIAGAKAVTNTGTINVVGTLSITGAINAINSGTVRVCGCTGGKLEGTINYSDFGTVTTYDGHYYVDGKCFACGYECTHEDLKCNTCGKNFPQKAISSEGGIASTLSEGNMTIATGIAGFAVGMAVMFVIMRKKKAE